MPARAGAGAQCVSGKLALSVARALRAGRSELRSGAQLMQRPGPPPGA
jgi:hypothetical protein